MAMAVLRHVTFSIMSVHHVMAVALVAKVSDLYRAGSILPVAWYALSNH